MAAAAFDTLRFARSLRDKAHLSPDQAEGFADAIAEALQGDIATKTDLNDVRADIRSTEAALRSEIKATELRLKTDIEASKSEILKWMIGTIGIQTILILGTVLTLTRAIRP